MITSEYILELSNVFHSGQVRNCISFSHATSAISFLTQVEAGSCLQKMIGTVRTGVILKDVSMEVHGGELSAVLGSKGKREILFSPSKLKLTDAILLSKGAESGLSSRSFLDGLRDRPEVRSC